MNTNLDALIVGAGPVGLSMAATLGMHGLRFRIIDSAPARVNESRAIGIQACTLEVFEMAGIIDEFLELGQRVHGVNIYGARGGKIGHLHFDAIPSRYSFILTLAQSETERILVDHLNDLDVRIERRTTLLSFAQYERGVAATVSLPDGSREEIQTDWLLGCDGARSRVREVLNLQFAGKTCDLHFLLGDVHAGWPLRDEEVHVFGTKGGLLAVFPLGNGLFRLVADNPADRFRSEKKPTL
jgi:3-(3-hydroxy-phenyl)propionate hydroxylase